MHIKVVIAYGIIHAEQDLCIKIIIHVYFILS
jgi:hypothetical protein